MFNFYNLDTDAIIKAAGGVYPSLSQDLFIKLRAELQAPKSTWLPSIRYANTDELEGFLGEYRPSTNTVVLNSGEFDPNIHNDAKNFVLAHELGHFLEQLTPYIVEAHDQTNQFATEVAGGKPDFSAYSNYLGIQKSREDGSQGFDTGYHSGMSYAALEQLGVKHEVLKGDPTDKGARPFVSSDVMQPGEGEVYAGNWDSDRFNTFDNGAGNFSLIAGVILGPTAAVGSSEIIKSKVGRSNFGLQMDSSSHFDENNFEGGFASQAHRRQSAIKSFFDTDIAAKNSLTAGGHDPLANPKFSGDNAGVQNYLYRLGQVLHALQDIYSHSTFVNLAYVSGGKWDLQDKIIDNSWDFGRLYQKGDVFAGKVVFAKHGPVTYSGLGTSNLAAKASFSPGSPLSRENVWWNVVSKGQNTFTKDVPDKYLSDGFGEVFSFTNTGQIIAGLMSGSLSPKIYSTAPATDLQTYIPVFDSSQKGIFDDGVFRGLSHGGPAGNKTGWWVAPLAKDHNDSLNGRSTNDLIKGYKNPNFTANTKIDQFLSLQANAQLFAIKQTLHEWDRFAVLLYNTWEAKSAGKGKEALEKLAAYAINSSESSQFVSRIISLSADIKAGKSDSSYLSSIQFPSYDPEGSTTNNIKNWSSLKFTLEDPVDYVPVSTQITETAEDSGDTEQPRRRIELFTAIRPDAVNLDALNTLIENSMLVDQIYLEEKKVWAIANNRVDAHSHNEVVVTPLDFDYLQAGMRASWSELISDGRMVRFVDKQNADKTVVIGDFDVESEVIGIFDQATNKYEIISDINLAIFAQEKSKIYQDYNIILDAKAIKKSAEPMLAVTTEQIRKAIEEFGFYAISASSFFLDPDTEGDASSSYHKFLFTGYLEQYSWIKLVDGQLVIDSLEDLPKAGEFYISAPISDGASINYSDLIQLTLNPSLTDSGGVLNINSNSVLSFESSYAKSNAWTLAYQVLNDEGAGKSNFVQLFGRSGTAAGSVNGLDEASGSYKFRDLATHGKIKFFLIDPLADAASELKLAKIDDKNYRLLLEDETIVSFNLASDPSQAELSPVQHITLRGQLLGYYLPESNQFGLNNDSTLYKVSGSIYSEADNSNTIGFVLVDNDTGEFIDPITGAVYSSIDRFSSSESVSDSFNSFYASSSLYQQKVLKNAPTEFSFDFKLDNSLVSSRYTIMPYLQSSSGDDVNTFTSGIFNDHSLNHATFVGGGIGFEDQLNLGDGDFDDAIVVVNRIEQVLRGGII